MFYNQLPTHHPHFFSFFPFIPLVSLSSHLSGLANIMIWALSQWDIVIGFCCFGSAFSFYCQPAEILFSFGGYTRNGAAWSWSIGVFFSFSLLFCGHGLPCKWLGDLTVACSRGLIL
ncbi:hypothetical protein EV426DRAFT_594118 [Tirmania nivea]|nr:hypothetical protein EV426DRAFT_594118 [Tirmania nivea]